jgi:CRP/FNR family cyclic AMP-dependent transcriptional regulator
MASETDLFSRFGRNVDAGKVIFGEGEEGDQMFIIQEGQVKVSRNISGKEQILAILEKGDFFGEMAIVTKVKRTATVTALSAVKLLAFDREGFLNMITKNARIALNVIDKLCRRLQNANLHIKHLARKDIKALIAMNLRFAFQGASERGASLLYDRTVDEFSQNLELTQDQVRSTLDGFVRAGMLEIQGNGIHLLDEQKLDSLAEQLSV